MPIFNSESKKQRNNLIMLQNIVLEIDEKKLQVSEEFLEKMTKIYISKYMKAVNENLTTITKVTNIGLLFKKYDTIMLNLDALIKIEELHKFRQPKPSEFKKMVEDKLDHYILSLISREWRKVSPQNNSNLPELENQRRCGEFFDSFDKYIARMPEESISTLEKLKKSMMPDEAAAAEEIAANAEQIPEDDGFVPETFETLEMPSDEEETPQISDEEMQ